MGPKKRAASEPKKPGRKPRAKKKPPVGSPVSLLSQQELIEAAHAVLDHNQTSQPRSQMSLILHKPNRLTEMIRNNQPPVSNRRRLSFEKDDGFKYKRGLHQTRNNGAMERLEREVQQLEDEYDDLEGVNTVVAPKKRQRAPGRQVGKARKGPQLSSPIQLPEQISHVHDGFSSDEYVELVSHEKIQLSQPSKRSRPGNRRRSSYNNRGKRLSSIGNGFEGMPHDDVSPDDYYKLLDLDLPEPQQMRQLLVWAMRKRLHDDERRHSNDDQTVVNIAKVIKDEVIQQLVLGDVNINWYNRRGHAGDGPEVMLPNPLNIQNANNLVTFKKKLQNLQAEQQEWHSSFQRAVAPLQQSKIHDNGVELDPSTASTYQKSVLDHTLLNELETTANDITTHKLSQQVEQSVDKLYHSTYRLGQVLQLVDSLQRRQFDPRLSQLLKKYMRRATASEPTTRQLLRGLTRMPQD